MSLRGKTLFISGASRGIGLAIAVRAARDGANVAIAAKSDQPNPRLPGTIHTAAEAIEAVVRGDRRTSRVIGRSLEELDLPEATTIGGIVRGDKLLIAHHDVVIEPGDHVILFVMDKRQMPQVNALFQAGA